MEGHPAHSPLPVETHTEAMDALKWSYTGTLGRASNVFLNSPACQTASFLLLDLRRRPSLRRNARS